MRRLPCHIPGRFAVVLLAYSLLVACGTGIEVTEHVTDKDVKRVITQTTREGQESSLVAYRDSVPVWRTGKKRFWVADDQVRLLFGTDRNVLADTASSLSGHVLVYQGYDIGSIYDNRQTLNLIFKDIETSCTYVYRTGKTLIEFGSSFSIPMLIDLDMIDHVSQQIAGKDYYINTLIWYDRETEQMMNGRHYIKVHIDSVLPGNAVMPMRVLFTTHDTGQRAMVWMCDQSSTMLGRDFDALFDTSDPHLLYPAITEKNWELITQAQVAEGMTKEECRLALGSPKHINQNPDQGGMREYWYYDGGSYLFFIDGLLNHFRR